MKKAPEAFRTISEVSDLLDTPAHVLRFWESKFYQIRPVKRAGGRRYYRPEDVALLTGIRLLLQEQGMTIRGVQKILQEQGVRKVSALAETQSSGQEEDALEMPAPRPPAPEPEDNSEAEAPMTEMAEPEPRPAADVIALPARTIPPAPPPPPAPAMPTPAMSQGAETPAPAAKARKPAARPVPPATDDLFAQEHLVPGDARLAQLLRERTARFPAVQQDRIAYLSRRLDQLLDRMSDAAGAGRW